MSSNKSSPQKRHTKSGRVVKGTAHVTISGAGVLSVNSGDIVTSTEGRKQIKKLKSMRNEIIHRKVGNRKK